MSQNNSGSTMLVILVVFSVLTIIAGVVYKQTILFNELALARQTYEKHRSLTESLLSYGIAYAKKEFESIRMRSRTPLAVSLNWPEQDSVFLGALTFKSKGTNELILLAQLEEDRKKLCIIQCSLERVGTSYYVHRWKENQ